MKLTIKRRDALLPIVLLLVGNAWANNTTQWIDKQHANVRDKLNHWSNDINYWLGEDDPNDPASASLRVMVDSRWNRYDGFTYKPRVRAKIKLPVLKKHLRLIIGDEDIDNETRNKNRMGKNNENIDHQQNDNFRQSGNNNASIGLRWSKGLEQLGLSSDLDLGLRSKGDLYTRLKLSKKWDWTAQYRTRVEQIYRYGLKSKHYLRTNIEQVYQNSQDTAIMNHTFLQYTYNKKQELTWGNSLYHQHLFNGNKTLKYGVFIGGRLDNAYSRLNAYGPFITYRQPIWKNWIFIQPELRFYNDKDQARKHHLNAFLKFELIF